MSTRADNPCKTPTPVDRTVRRTLTNELPLGLRRVYTRVLGHTLNQGVPVKPDALAVLLTVLDERFDEPLRFSPEMVEQLLWYEVAEFCAEHSLEAPIGCGEALFALVAISIADESLGARAEDPEAVFGVLRQLSSV